jgi:hypothetical protein
LSQNETIPTVADIDAAWLSNLLGTGISSVTSTPVGTGQMGATFRFDLGQDATSLIGKFTSDDPTSRATGKAQGSYLREISFYQHFGAHTGLPIPKAHFAAIDPETHAFALIMEDFPHHRSGNQLEPATLAEAQLAMKAAGRIHGAFWGDETLDQHAWLSGSKAAPFMDVDGLYNLLWPAFCHRYQDQINDNIKAVGDGYLGRLNDWIAQRDGPRCLTHGDFRPDNMLFLDGDASKPLVIVDWQTAGVGSGATDVAYYLGTALSADMRRKHEAALIDLWTAELVACGVPDADTQDLWAAYQRDSVAGFLMGVLASMIVVQTARGDAMFLEMCKRSAHMVLDHGVLETL